MNHNFLKINLFAGVSLLIILCVGKVFAYDELYPLEFISPAKLKQTPVQCEKYIKGDYKGELISFNFQRTDIQTVLKKLSNQLGCGFVIDKSVGLVAVNLNVKNILWNTALEKILRQYNLSVLIEWAEKTDPLTKIKTRYPFLWIADNEALMEEWRSRGCSFDSPPPVATEAIKLKKLVLKNVSQNGVSYLTENSSKFTRIIGKMLSQRGELEINTTDNSLVVTDTKENLNSIIEQIKNWDNSGFTLDELVSNIELKSRKMIISPVRAINTL